MVTLQTACLLFAVAVLAEDNIVVVKNGPIRGSQLTTRNGRKIAAFRGIPYAKPPVGDLRFKRSQSADPWTGVLDATQDSPECLQRGLYTPEAPLSGQENCLYLNVYTPKMPDGSCDYIPLDVMFWIHGGGWFSGSSTSNVYGPEYLLDKDVILVTINYRLGPLGFLSTGDAACSGNNGLKDQVLALRWVQDNIAAFGGNPDSVTIFGESTGAASVHYHMLSPLSKGLFHRAISESGTALDNWTHAPNGTTRYMAEKLARIVDCPTEQSDDMIACLRSKDATDIIGTDNSFIEWNQDPMIPFKPVVETEVAERDEAFISQIPVKVLRNSDYSDLVPWMVGINPADGTIAGSSIYGTPGRVEEFNQRFDYLILLPTFFRESAPHDNLKDIAHKIRKFYFGDQPISNDTAKEVVQMYTDMMFLYGIYTATKIHIAKGASVYSYVFDYRGTNSYSTIFGDKTRDYGVSHMDELMYLFPQDSLFPDSGEKKPEDEDAIDTLTTLWTNFARTGNPTPDQDEWPRVSSPDKQEYACITSHGIAVEAGYRKKAAKFWSTMPFITTIAEREH